MRAALSHTTTALAEETVWRAPDDRSLDYLETVIPFETCQKHLNYTDIHICTITRKNAAHFQISPSSSRRHPL